jgi:SAM-dependent methyltransferase
LLVVDVGWWLTAEMRERRLVFGEVAELYDSHRPSYPAALVDDLVALAELDGNRAVLEVGAGTGKATVLFAVRGIPVVAVEPSAEMAKVARRHLLPHPAVELERTDFEGWDPRGRQFPLLFSAQAWHWIAPAAGYAKARAVLDRRGLLAPFWNNVVWTESALREPLLAAYLEAAPDLDTDGPMHPANLAPDAIDWEAEIGGIDGFGDPVVRGYEWECDYATADYLGLLGTLSEIRLLDEGTRSRLLEAVGATIDAHGGRLTLPLRTRLCMARRA